MKDIELIEKGLSDYKNVLSHHKVYRLLSEVADIRLFMEKHVYAVWDFMSLLKSLQNQLTCVSIPWKPVKNSSTARFINEIVLGEETDTNGQNAPKSHFEMYLEAMEDIHANTSKIMKFLKNFNQLSDYKSALENSNLKPSEKSFLNFTFETIKSGESHKIAAAFTFGREDLIPDMFMAIINNPENGGIDQFPKLKYYLDRHIELDGDEHGPLSLQMIQELCGNDQSKWQDVMQTAKEALIQRIGLWDEIASEIERHKEPKAKLLPN